MLEIEVKNDIFFKQTNAASSSFVLWGRAFYVRSIYPADIQFVGKGKFYGEKGLPSGLRSHDQTVLSNLLIGFTFFVLFSLQCQNYTILNNADRKETYGNAHGRCDNTIGPGSFRFEGAAGTRIATSCLPINRCDASYPGSVNGRHPTVADGKVTRQVYFHRKTHSYDYCYHWSTNIQVRICGSYHVYFLSGTPAFSLRYCGSD